MSETLPKTEPEEVAEAVAPLSIEPDLLDDGIVSGVGNQGTANTAHLTGQSGTGGTQISLPAQLHFGRPFR
jgi:hypothetical protein